MTNDHEIPLWGRHETSYRAQTAYAHPVQDVEVRARITAPSGEQRTVEAFWDGGDVWRVRVRPDELGRWTYETECSNPPDGGLHGQRGAFECVPAAAETPFERHGSIGVSADGRRLSHADGTRFFWLADTAWNGPLLSTDEEWGHYLRRRAEQSFTAVQWVATHWRASPRGDRDGRLAYTGVDRIAIDPEFFQRLDGKLEAINRAGLLAAPVMLWANPGRQYRDTNPGYVLPEDQAALLARYMAARWGAHDVLWLLPGDWDYEGENAERWKRIGRAVFGGRRHAPVALHPKGKSLPDREFEGEEWLDVIGYQSGHYDDEESLRWIVQGPVTERLREREPRVIVNLEPPYENHIGNPSGERLNDHNVRRAVCWSLLVSHTAGVSYGGHGVWGWDDGTAPSTDHPNSGVPLHWREALEMPGAKQMGYIRRVFESVDWHRLRPAPGMAAEQPGDADPASFVAASITDEGDLAVAYTPTRQPFALSLDGLKARGLRAVWHSPLRGESEDAGPVATEGVARFEPPDIGDWLLIIARRS